MLPSPNCVLLPKLPPHFLCVDPGIFSNHRPITNISFLSEILEKAVAQWLTGNLFLYNLFKSLQCGFLSDRRTETALPKISITYNSFLTLALSQCWFS